MVPGVLAHLLFPFPHLLSLPPHPSPLPLYFVNLTIFLPPSLPPSSHLSFFLPPYFLPSFLSHVFISHPQIQLRVWRSALSCSSRVWSGSPVEHEFAAFSLKIYLEGRNNFGDVSDKTLVYTMSHKNVYYIILYNLKKPEPIFIISGTFYTVFL